MKALALTKMERSSRLRSKSSSPRSGQSRIPLLNEICRRRTKIDRIPRGWIAFVLDVEQEQLAAIALAVPLVFGRELLDELGRFTGYHDGVLR